MLNLFHFATVLVLGISTRCVVSLEVDDDGESLALDPYPYLFSSDSKRHQVTWQHLLDGIVNLDTYWSDSQEKYDPKYYSIPYLSLDDDNVLDIANKKYFDGIAAMEEASRKQSENDNEPDVEVPAISTLKDEVQVDVPTEKEWERKYEDLKNQNALLLDQVSEMKERMHDQEGADLYRSETPQVSGNYAVIPLVAIGGVVLLVIIAVAVWQFLSRNTKQESPTPEIQNKSRSASLEEVIVMDADATPNVSPNNSTTAAEIKEMEITVTTEPVAVVDIPDQIR